MKVPEKLLFVWKTPLTLASALDIDSPKEKVIYFFIVHSDICYSQIHPKYDKI